MNNIIAKISKYSRISILLFPFITVAQTYEFKVKNPVRYKFEPTLYDGITFEYQGKREYINKNVFYETSVLREVDTFKICANKWRIKSNGVWKLFFSEKKFKKNIVVQWKNLYLKPKEKREEDGQIYYFYYLGVEKEFIFDEEHYYSTVSFSPKEGIMKINYENFSLYREWTGR